MHQCDIMVKDVDDSKRLNANVHTTIKAKAADAKAKGEGGEDGPRVAGGGHHGGGGDTALPSGAGNMGDGGGGDAGASGDASGSANEGGAAAPDVVTATIVSEHFWPSLVDDSMELHPWPQKHLGRFNDTYSVLKTPRSKYIHQNLRKNIKILIKVVKIKMECPRPHPRADPDPDLDLDPDPDLDLDLDLDPDLDLD